MVVFATPGMLHAGLSLQIFKKWAPSDQNMVGIFCLCFFLFALNNRTILISI